MTVPAGRNGSGRIGRAARRKFDGIVLLDKPAGLTSNHALQRVRRVLSAVKAGHAGTLDPMATGMLPLCFGQATKTCGIILGARKAYRARLRLGAATDTGDAQGRIVSRAEVPQLDSASAAAVLADFEGERDQVPPMVSALKVAGERLYELARRGESVPRAARRIELHRLGLVGLDGQDIEFDVECSKGTYIRVLGAEVAARLGTVGHLAALRRLWVAPFASEPMVTLDEIGAWQAGIESAGWDPGDRRGRPSWLHPVDFALTGYARVDLASADSLSIRNGRTVPSDRDLPPGTTVRAYDAVGELLGLLRVETDGRLQVVRLFVDTAG